MRRLIWIYLLAACGTANAADLWWEIRIGGQPAGYQHMMVERLDDGAIRTTEEQLVVLNRLGSKVEMKEKVQSVENADGTLKFVREESASSEQSVVTEAEIETERILLRSTSGANSYSRSIFLRAPLCGPQKFARMAREQLRQPGDKVDCRLYQPSTNPYRQVLTLVGQEELGGRKLLRASMTIDESSAVSVLLDSDGFMYQIERDLPFGHMVIRATDRETALKAATGGSLPQESYGRTLARSNVRFADGRAVESIKLRITHKKPELGWPELRGPFQTIVEKTASSVVLEVNPFRPPGGAKEDDEARFLKPNPILQSDDPEVLRLARETAGDEHDRFKAVRRLQDWVSANLKYDLGIAVAPASEVVRNRRGTCVAYAVLLASMGRAIGVPTRVAMGYAYFGGTWGGHAWTEALIDGRWMPFDAAAYRAGFADGARFQFDSYTAEDNLTLGSLAGLQLYGNVEVTILEYVVAGKTIRVEPGAKGYSIAGNEYRNPTVGFSMRKPDGFDFGKLDAVYPDSTLLELRSGNESATIALIEGAFKADKSSSEPAPGVQLSATMLDGRDAVKALAAGIAQLVMRDGQSMWVINVYGRDAGELLDRLMKGWKWISPE